MTVARRGPWRGGASRLVVRARPGTRSRGLLSFGSFLLPCALGRGGITRRKREGDGATPAGRFEVLDVYFRADRGRRPVTALPVSALRPADGWCDDPAHPRYNRPVTLPFAASHEEMWRQDRLYDIVVVLDCNLRPAVRGRGSAIFFHIAREDWRPTLGCVAIRPDHMRRLLARLRPGAVMEIL
ncbi:L,D-transpeptidase family protein [Pannonibacter tanglangensis]|uniref:L,D-transpeptidase family protein n=1 Tax=Pannonibacter tanglangensis TaxID=2750084 RepID=A0ABW9ZPM0_9HYPH|nr:L,D-transpeptidase family protein [Pannonibacter sp. XCT-34]NBN65526.1 L,D-transpeptidase family protein [Pannonibacter sp. XCT-34]